MKVYERIIPEVKDSVVTLTGKWDTVFKFLGSSCPASVHPGQTVSSLTLSLGDDEPIVALETQRYTQTGKYGNWEHGYFLFQVTKEGKIIDPFVPKADRIGQIVPDVGLSVRIGDEFFLAPLLVSECKTEEKMATLAAQYRNVGTANANLLCRFIAGKAEADEVKAAAEELLVQTVDVPLLRIQLAEAQARSDVLETKQSNLLSELQDATEKHQVLVELSKQAALIIERRDKCISELNAGCAQFLKGARSVIQGTDGVGFLQRTRRAKLARILTALSQFEDAVVGKG